jgi:hypothetical protein
MVNLAEESVVKESRKRLYIWKEYFRRKGMWSLTDDLAFVHLLAVLDKQIQLSQKGGESE